MAMKKAKPKMSLSAVRKAWSLLAPAEQRRGVWTLALMILSGFSAAGMIGSIMPFLTVLAQPKVIETQPILEKAYHFFGFTSHYSFLQALGLASLCMIIFSNLIQLMNNYSMIRYAQRCGRMVGERLFRAYLTQPYAFFLNRNSAMLGTQVLSESQAVVDRFFQPMAQLIASFCTFLMVVSLLLIVNPKVTFVAFCIVAGSYGAILFTFRERLTESGRRRAEANALRFRIANEALSGIKGVKLEGRENDLLARFAVPSRVMEQSIVSSTLAGSMPTYLMQIVAFGGLILTCLVLMTPVGLASGMDLTVILPVVGVFALAGQKLLPEISSIYRSITMMRFGTPIIESVWSDIALEAGVSELPQGTIAPLHLQERLDLRAIGFRYSTGSEAGLTDLTFTIKAGERIGIVGSTGAGKTTLVDVILGLLRPNEGEVCVDGVPITDENLRAWQRGLAYVPQEVFLIDASIADNIALGVGSSPIDMDRLRHAAQVARLDHYVEHELPQGYDTIVGERGVRMSGGQRQRIALARAIYRDAKVIILDEATSALDNLTEREVIDALYTLPGDKTVLMIAHRLTTLRGCDRILVLDRGRLVEIGPPETLTTQGGAFKKLLHAGT